MIKPMCRLSLSTPGRLLLLLLCASISFSLSAKSLPEDTGSIDGQWLIKVPEGQDAREVASALGAIYIKKVRGAKDYHSVEFAKPLASSLSDIDWRDQLTTRLEASDEIEAFEKLEEYERYPRSFVPSDPLFADQWHLENEGQSGGTPFADTQVRGAWNAGINGTGVVVGIVDTGTQYNHPDLSANWRTGRGIDVVDNDNDASPAYDNDIRDFERHGTAVAGISVAASNSIGGLGIAYNAEFVPIRLLGGSISQADEIEGITYGGWDDGDYVDVYNNSWGPSDNFGVRFVDISSAVKTAIRNNTQFGRGGLGAIYVWAAGNGGLNGDISNFDAYNASPYTISVGAVGHDDIKAGYSEPGANLLVVAPSGGRGGGILTTDLTGSDGYSSGSSYEDFSGTSAASPMVAGVVALMLDARPDLNWRDVQQILALTASPVDFIEDKWSQNAAGLWVSHDYGFGRVDAKAAVELARDWESLPSLTTLSGTRFMNSVSLLFKQTRTGSINISQNVEVHNVSVTVSLNHSNWGDLHIELESPSGSRTLLSEPHRNANQSLFSHTFLSTHQLKESSLGAWKLHVTDDGTDGEGSWSSWSISIIGHTLEGATNQSPVGDDLVLERTSFPVEIDTFDGLTDPEGDSLEILAVQQPASGELEDLGGGLFAYTMGDTKTGWDSFSVLYGDGNGGVKRRLIRILDPRPVGRVDLLPLVAGQSYELPVLSNDLDPDGDPLRLLSAVPESGGIGFQGDIQVLPNQNVQYSSSIGDAGVARFQYNLTDDSDGESSGWATLVLSPESDVAVTLDGEDDHLLIGPTTGINMRDRFTLEAWIYPESYGEYVTGFGRIFDRDTFLFYLNGFDHTTYNDQSLVAYFILQDGQTFTAANSAANVIQLNKWQHVALSFNSSDFSAPVKMYVDGIQVPLGFPLAGTSAPRSPVFNNSNLNLFIGENEDGARAFKGSLAELRVWNTALSSATIQSRHDRRLTGSEPNLQLYLPLDQTLEPEAISIGTFKGKATIFEGLRVPRILPWAQLEEDLSIVANGNNGWWEERTLGWFYGDAYPWVYLPYAGWSIVETNAIHNSYAIYPVENNWGWLYTSPQVFPWLYRVDDQSWILYDESQENGPWLYFHAESSWLRPQEDAPDS